MVGKFPKWGCFLFQMAFPWLTSGGDPNHLLTGMILHVPAVSMNKSFLVRPPIIASSREILEVPMIGTHTNRPEKKQWNRRCFHNSCGTCTAHM